MGICVFLYFWVNKVGLEGRAGFWADLWTIGCCLWCVIITVISEAARVM